MVKLVRQLEIHHGQQRAKRASWSAVDQSCASFPVEEASSQRVLLSFGAAFWLGGWECMAKNTCKTLRRSNGKFKVCRGLREVEREGPSFWELEKEGESGHQVWRLSRTLTPTERQANHAHRFPRNSGSRRVVLLIFRQS